MMKAKKSKRKMHRWQGNVSLALVEKFLRFHAIPRKAFEEFAETQGVSLMHFFGSVEEQRESLEKMSKDFKRIMARERKPEGVFSGFGSLPDELLKIIDGMGDTEDLKGRSEDKKRMQILERELAIMLRHLRLSRQIALKGK